MCGHTTHDVASHLARLLSSATDDVPNVEHVEKNHKIAMTTLTLFKADDVEGNNPMVRTASGGRE